LGDLLYAISFPRLQWRSSDRALMESFFAFYHPSYDALRFVIAAPLSADQRRDARRRVNQD
ncbi:hypothetical protein LY76DRAFT_482467, partial [Colletotrichum caudatum]